jgi:hypothetical protein
MSQHHSPRSLLAALCCAVASCSGPQQREAVSHALPAGSMQDWRLVGHWVLEVSPDPDMPTPRLRMELRIDSTVGDRVFGALTHYLAGDVGIDPSTFPVFEGRVHDDGSVLLRIGHVDPQMHGFVLAGRTRGDTIPLELFVIGPDTASGWGQTWYLVRPPAP